MFPELNFVMTRNTSLCLSGCCSCCKDCLTGKSKLSSAQLSRSALPVFAPTRGPAEPSGSSGGVVENMALRLRGTDGRNNAGAP